MFAEILSEGGGATFGRAEDEEVWFAVAHR